MMKRTDHGDFESIQFNPGDEVQIAPPGNDAEYQTMSLCRR